MAFQGDSIFWVEVEKIVPNPFQPRREFDQDKLQELGDSIRMYGVLQPLTVTRKEVHREDGTFYTEYELIAGERRLRASKLAKVEQVPVIIRSGEQTEQEKLELAIIENLQREDLNAVDRALAFKQLAESFDLSFTQVAKKVGRSREYVSNSVRLLALPDHILESLKRGEITEGHGRTLLMLKDKPEELEVVYKEILLKKLSVREVERIARKIASDKVRKKSWVNTDAHLIEMERQFTDTLGTRVQISKTDYGGKLTIDYFTESELEKLLHVIKSQRTLLENATDTDTSTAPKIQELADAESALEALTRSTPLRTDDSDATNTAEMTPAADAVAEATATVATPDTSEEAVPTLAAEPTPVMPDTNADGQEAVSGSEPTAEHGVEVVSPAEAEPAETAQHAVAEVAEPVPSQEGPAVNPHMADTTAAPARDVDQQSYEQVAPNNPVADSVATLPEQPDEESVSEAPVHNATAETEPLEATQQPAEPVASHSLQSEPAPDVAAPAEQQQPMPTTGRYPRVVAIHNDKKSYITDMVDMTTQRTAGPAQAETAPTNQSVENNHESPAAPEKTDSDDEDLYSINRFSI